MAEIVITLKDNDQGGVSVHSDFKPAIGARCSLAQAAALDIVRRTSKEYGLQPPVAPTSPVKVDK